jgi:hypothetical protein
MWSKCLQEKIFSKEINDGSLGLRLKVNYDVQCNFTTMYNAILFLMLYNKPYTITTKPQ